MNAPINLSLLPRTARVETDGRLSIGGCDLEELADRFGTPLFVYDEDDIRSRCAQYAEGFGADAVIYASKAFPSKAMAAIIAAEGLAIDVSTDGELDAAQRGGVPAARTVFHGNNKSLTELRAACTLGVGRIVVDSFDELDRIEALAASDLPVPRLLVRVTPGIEAHTHEYIQTGIEDTKFGFSIGNGDAARAVSRIAANPALTFAGLHCHIGSQIFEVKPLQRTVEIIADLALQLAGEVSVTELDLGGGLGIAYTNADDPITIDDYAEALNAAVIDAWTARDLGAPPRILVEPGRSLVGTAGVTLYRVGTVKDIPDVRTYVSVDGGMSDNLRHALYGADYEAFLPARVLAPRPRSVTITGRHCEQGDLIAEGVHLPADIGIGDVLCTPATGAYGYAMASNYNRVPRPAVVFVRDGEARLVIRRETLADLAALEQ